MAELKDIIVAHKRIMVQVQDAMYMWSPAERCADDCPACAQHELLEWEYGTCYEHYTDGEERELLRICCDKCMEALRKEVLEVKDG